MHSPVIFRAARALQRRGVASLRFNFRSVGRSQGEFDEGIGERGDVLAALDYLSSRLPAMPIRLLGYSFGALVGFAAAALDPRVDSLIGIGMPLALGSFDFLVMARKPLLAVQGERDEYGDPRDLERLILLLGAPSKLVVVAGSDHLFTGRLDIFEESLAAALAGINEQAP
jgi:alpha/beta superfamily hydrolase